MTILIFIVVLLVLVLVHEAGHFFAAKISGVRVDEFAFGFPPKLFSFKKGETTYKINLIPLGGYVKIHGENGQDETEDKDIKRNFSNKHPLLKIFILSAGVIMNIVLAFLLISISAFTFSANSFNVDKNPEVYQTFLEEGKVKEEFLTIVSIQKKSPAEASGLKVGNKVLEIYLNKENASGKINQEEKLDQNQSGESLTKQISEAINSTGSNYVDSITIVYKDKKDEISTTTLAGVYNLEGNMDKKVIGLALSKTAIIKIGPLEAFKIGFYRTTEYTMLTLVGFKNLFVDLIGKGTLSQDIAGPVGIFEMVGEAKVLGMGYLFLFTSVLSISLAIFNILPFPALDGGRILFVIIEWISGKRISEKWQVILNSAGLILLLLLMVLVTVKDVLKLF